MQVYETIAEYLAWRDQQKGKVAFVPTMGGLHEGHLSLVKKASSYASQVVVSIFVNPLQFGPTEDFLQYPRTLSADLALLAPLGVTVVFTPTAADMYPEGKGMEISPGEIEKRLCGISRPHFFTGVTTVVMKLLNVIRPDYVFLGEKDYQQYCILKKMVKDFFIQTKIIPVETMREVDGLAMSSRNRYLSPEDRKKAPVIYKTLQEMRAKIKENKNDTSIETWGKRCLEEAGFKLDYLSILDEKNLEIPTKTSESFRIFVAVWLNGTRLIDNIAV